MDLVAGGLEKIRYDHWHLISISCPDTHYMIKSLIDERTSKIFESQGCGKILPLQFDDMVPHLVFICERNGFHPQLFSMEQARQVIDFVDDIHKEEESAVLVVHCDAGVSRSGAIAQFVSEYLSIQFDDPDIRPNKYVMRLLNQCLKGELGDNGEKGE